MSKYARSRYLSVFWFAMWVGMTVNSVGQTTKEATYDWWLPVCISTFILVNMYLGYYVGKTSKEG